MQGNILVVGKDAPILFAMSDYLRSQGYKVDCADALGDGRSVTLPSNNSLVVVDLGTQQAEHVAVLDCVKSMRKASCTTPVIVLSAQGSQEMEAQAKLAGVDALIQKPQSLAEVVRIIRRLLENAA
jgi:DNA-binding response OmpR family regulator